MTHIEITPATLPELIGQSILIRTLQNGREREVLVYGVTISSGEKLAIIQHSASLDYAHWGARTPAGFDGIQRGEMRPAQFTSAQVVGSLDAGEMTLDLEQITVGSDGELSISIGGTDVLILKRQREVKPQLMRLVQS